MVKLQFYIVEKPNKTGSKVGNYEVVRLNFPKDLHQLLRGFRDKKIEVKAYQEGKTIHIILTEKVQ
jgi:hypothetical protein